MVRAMPCRVVEMASGAVEQCLARERVTVATQPGTGHADDDVARAGARGKDTRTVDHSHGKTDEVELARLHEVRMLRHLTTEQRAPGLATAVRDPGDDVV